MKTNSGYSLSVVIPIFNESDGIRFLVKSLNDFFEKHIDISTEIIFVNDGSSDDSFTLLKNENHQYYKARLISLSKNYGSHAAMRAGFLNSTNDLCCCISADLQEPLEILLELREKIIEGCDFAWGYRKTTKRPFSEKIFSNLFAFVMRKFAFSNYPDKGFDVLMFNDKVRVELNKNIEANSNVFLQVFSFGFRQGSITFHKQERKIGKSKWTLSKKVKIFIDSFVAFSYAPIRFVTIMGIIFFTVGCLWTIYIALRKILIGDLASGWPALTSILLIGFGVTNISLGIIAEYLWRTLDSSRKRPVFIIEDMVDVPRSNLA